MNLFKTKKNQFSRGLFRQIPFLYFFLHKSWIWQTLGHVMDIFFYRHIHNPAKECFWPKKNQISCTGSKVPFWKNWIIFLRSKNSYKQCGNSAPWNKKDDWGKKIFVSFRDSKRRRKWKLTVGSNSKNVRNLEKKKPRMDRKPVEQLWQLKGRFLSSPTTPLWPIILKYNPKTLEIQRKLAHVWIPG